MPMFQDDNDDVIIKSASGLQADVVADSGYNRLAVLASLTNTPIVPKEKVIFISSLFLNGSSKIMGVSGTLGSPVHFTLSPPSGQVWYIKDVTLLSREVGTNSFDKFMTLTALTNGLQLNTTISSTNYEILNLKDNSDMMVLLSDAGGTGGSWEVLDLDSYRGRISFPGGLTLNGTNGDFIRWSVRDNLSTLDRVQACASYWRVI